MADYQANGRRSFRDVVADGLSLLATRVRGGKARYDLVRELEATEGLFDVTAYDSERGGDASQFQFTTEVSGPYTAPQATPSLTLGDIAHTRLELQLVKTPFLETRMPEGYKQGPWHKG